MCHSRLKSVPKRFSLSWEGGPAAGRGAVPRRGAGCAAILLALALAAPPIGSVAVPLPPVLPRLAAAEADAAGVEFFERKIRPVLVEHCEKCHGGKSAKGGLRLDSRAGWLEGGDSGPAVVPGKPDESLLIQAVRYGGDYEMPPAGRLPDAVVRDLEQWVLRGAPDPRAAALPAKASPAADLAAGRQHWAYRPVSLPAVPSAGQAGWPATPVDSFVLDRLQRANLSPAAEAPRDVLARRLYLDLTGLTPSPEEVAQFVDDPAPDAFERLVDRLMASPHFGERWGRHWLDLARFAESVTLRGTVMKEAWRYRDYVIGSFNGDRPYDRFIATQIAGDLLPASSLEERQQNLIATAYLALGNTNLEEQDKSQLDMDVIDEQLDVIGKGILAQTLSCARCHDHKFDPIPTRDYYALAGILRNVQTLEHANVSTWIEVPLPQPAELEEAYRLHREAVSALQEKIKAVKGAAATADGAAKRSPGSVVPLSDLRGIVVDDRAARRVGKWQESRSVKSYIGSGYLHDLAEGPGTKTLTFTPELPRDGRYEVRFAYTPGANRAARAPVTVFSAEGEKSLWIDQRVPPPLDEHFISLGTYRFERAGQSFVIVSNDDAGGHVVADAVQFLPVEADSRPASDTVPRASVPATASPERGGRPAEELKQLEEELQRRLEQAPPRPATMTVLERTTITEPRINIRGSVHNLGAAVSRGFLQVCGDIGARSFPEDQSGRRELAEWLVSPQHPLTARVMVNRIWQWLLGDGLVRTVDNFGTTGELPSHPELLDYLAHRFIARGSSVKSVVREIVLSRTYRQDSTSGVDPAAVSRDPENRWLARRSRRRLDAEELRDAMLLTSGQLRWEMGGPGFAPSLASDYAFAHQDLRRSVYLPVFRNSLPELFEAYDFADPSVVTGRRTVSTVATQALFMMNHPFVLEQSRRAAERLLRECPGDDHARVDRAFDWTLGRAPRPEERRTSLEFVRASANHSTGSSPPEPAQDAYARLFQSLFSSIDFRYVR